jgi:hypothetical protein
MSPEERDRILQQIGARAVPAAPVTTPAPAPQVEQSPADVTDPTRGLFASASRQADLDEERQRLATQRDTDAARAALGGLREAVATSRHALYVELSDAGVLVVGAFVVGLGLGVVVREVRRERKAKEAGHAVETH